MPFSRTGMRLFNGLGCSVSLFNPSHVISKSDVELTVFGLHKHCQLQAPLVVLEPVLEICLLREARWRCLAVRDGTSRLDCASRLDVVSLAANIFAPFGAVARISRTDCKGNSAQSSVRCVAAVGLLAIRTRGATGRRRAWRMVRFVPRPVGRRRLLVLINGRTGLIEQSAHDLRARPADPKSRSWFVYVSIGP